VDVQHPWPARHGPVPDLRREVAVLAAGLDGGGVMPTYSAHVVRRPRRLWECALCRKEMREHMRMYGCCEVGDKPYVMRACLACLAGTADPVVKRAMTRTPDGETGAGS
jgi:hypothetical protein